MVRKQVFLRVALLSSLLFLLTNATIPDLAHRRDTVVETPKEKFDHREDLPEVEDVHFSLEETIVGPQSPIQIVRPSKDHTRLELVEENLKFLQSINEPLSVIGVLGIYHSGKSFLLNELTGDTKGFAVGSTTERQTEGLWIRSTNLTGSDYSRVILLDTEGFFASNVEEPYDAKVFAISTLLSSHLLFNSMKVIDQASVDYLELLSRRTQIFQFKLGNQNATDLTGTEPESSISPTPSDLLDSIRSSSFPSLTWVVRDFHSKGNPNDWLRSYLEGSRDRSVESHRLDRIFDGIHCHTLSTPAPYDLQRLSDLSSVQHTELPIEFRNQVWNLKESLLGNLKAKTVGTAKMNGPALASLLRFLVTAANGEKLPELPSLWNSWLQVQTETARIDAIERYEKSLQSAFHPESPLSIEDFILKEKEENEKAITYYKDSLFNHEAAYGQGIDRIVRDLKEKSENYKERVNYQIGNLFGKLRSEFSENLEKEFDGLKSPHEIEEKYATLLNQKLDQFREKTAKYANSEHYKQGLEHVKEDLTAVKNDLLVASYRHVNHELDEATEAFRKEYESAAKELELPLPPSKLTEFHRIAVANSKNEFDRKVVDKAYRSEQIYRERLQKAENLAESNLKSLSERNEVLISELAEAEVQRLDRIFDSRLSEIHLPEEEEILLDVSKKIAWNLIGDFNETMRRYDESPAMIERRTRMEKDFSDRFRAMIDSNLLMVKDLSSDAFRCARSRLADRMCTLCLPNLLPWAYESEAKRIVEECFLESPATSKMSTNLRDRAFAEWYKTEDTEERRAVTNHFYVLSCVLIASIGFVAYQLQKNFGRRDQLVRDRSGPAQGQVKFSNKNNNNNQRKSKGGTEDVSHTGNSTTIKQKPAT